MKIYIPTYGRAARQVTLKNLPPALRDRVSLVVQQREAHLYAGFKGQVEVKVLPGHIRTIGPTRDWIIQSHRVKKHGDALVMLDDDIKFDTRRKDDPTKFLTSTEREVERLFRDLEVILQSYTHAGVLAREGGNRVTEEVIYCTRMMRVLAYNVREMQKEKIQFSRLKVMEDFDVTLSLLRRGHQNAILCNWVQGQGSSNAEGGCSHYRTLSLHAQSAVGLKKLHPEFVKLVQKKTKSAWGGEERTDVIVQWKRAYESSQR
jgi:hypothetical protein